MRCMFDPDREYILVRAGLVVVSGGMNMKYHAADPSFSGTICRCVTVIRQGIVLIA